MVTFLLPAGPKNLQAIFPDVDFTKVDEYHIQLKNKVDGSVVATTNTYQRACCENEDTCRLFFVNYLGAIDGVNGKRIKEDLEVKSSKWKKPLAYPLNKWDGGLQRSNVISNESQIIEIGGYDEEDQEWLKELLATPNAWLQWTGTQGQFDNYIPVIISDGKFVTRKEEERYAYFLQLEIEFSNDNIIIRN